MTDSSAQGNKGEKGCECNRTACNNGNAIYLNHSTRKYYCEECAAIINYYNQPDALRIFGHNLCTLDKS